MRQTGRNSRDTASRSGRSRTVLLALLGAALVADGTGRVPESLAGTELRAAAIEPGFAADDIESVLRSWNSSLDDRTLGRIAAAVERYSAQYALEPELVTAVIIVESSVRPWAYSPKGAVGLMQVMPHMIEPLKLAGNPTTIESNIEAGCWILSHNIRRLGEDRGISAYFWGSKIRNLAYLEKVQEARENLRRRTS